MLSWEHVCEIVFNIITRSRLKNSLQKQRFAAVSGRYSEICNRLLSNAGKSHDLSECYDWGAWADAIEQAFQDGVPLDFLAHPTVSFTMVFARRRGVVLTQRMLNDVIRVFGKEVATTIVLEDYIGLPTITSSLYMTSANRCHHATHLAIYTQQRNRNFWDCESIIEWGGGYGNMARIIRRMNPSITYTIIDLPELLALQYIYLASIEGEDNVHIVQPGLQLMLGKINLLSSQLAVAKSIDLECDAFISTWAITESPHNAQKFVKGKEFFGARNLLIASHIDQNNWLADSLTGIELSRIPLPLSRGVGKDNEYWFQ